MAQDAHIDGATVQGEVINRYVASPLPLAMPEQCETLASIVFAKSLLTYQNHYWHHCQSCFKPSNRIPKGNICRMFFPKEIEENSIDEDGRVHLERPIGHEYVNGHSDTIAATLKMNHDIKLLGAGEGLEKSHYMMKYATKDQEQIENEALIHLNAYDTATSRFFSSDDPVRTGTKRLLSMISTLTNAQEVTATQAGLYIERSSMNYSSHEFVKFSIKTFISALERTPCTFSLRHGDNPSVYETSSPFHDYVYRPPDLEPLSVYEYATQWHKRRGQTGLKLQPDHSHYRTQSVHRRENLTCFIPTGGRLPNINDPDLGDEKRSFFFKYLMIMFKPFRRLEDLVPTTTNWNEAFASWWQSDAARLARVYSERALDYYEARQIARRRPDEDIVHYNSLPHDGTPDENALNICDSDSEDDPQEDMQFDADGEENNGREAPSTYAPFIDHYQEAIDLVSSMSASNAHGQIHMDPNANELHREMEELDNSGTSSTVPTRENDHSMPEQGRSTRVSILSSVNLNPTWSPTPTPSTMNAATLEQYASLQDVSQHFRLNKKQHQMFVLAGSAFLRELQKDEGCSSGYQQQFRGFLAGLPGAGKSLVIKAIQHLAQSWNRPHAIKTLAFQGVAAQAANGETIHKCFGWRLKGIDDNWRPNQAQQEKFAAVKLLIIDEISTTDAKYLGQIDICLQRIRQNDHLFGGIHILLVGDWLQQLPIAGTPAFVEYPSEQTQESDKPDRSQRRHTAYIHQLRGSAVYHDVRTVVILDENMRHRGDPRWAQILDRWRFGDYRQDDLNSLNAVCYDREWTLPPLHQDDTFCPIIVSSNQLRHEFNQQAFRRHCAQTGSTWHRFPAVVTKARGSITESQRRSLECIRDDKSSNLAICLDLALGIPVQCTKNISTHLRLANGTIGHVVHIATDPSSCVTIEKASGQDMHLHTKLPKLVLVKLRGFEEHVFLPSLPPGVVPLFPHSQHSVTVDLPNRRINVNIVQIPLIPAYSITSDKSQGLTVSQMILGPMRHCTRNKPQRAAHYVATTRVRSMDRLLLMEPLTVANLSYFRPSTAVTDEVMRLNDLAQRTLSTL